MAYHLLSYRVLVLPDDGKTDRGEVVEGEAPFTWEITPPPPPPPIVGPSVVKTYHTHVVFCENMAQLVTQGGVDYYGMHRDAIIGFLD